MKIDSYILNLIDEMHVLMHRIDGYLDAKADLKPQLRFVEDDDPKVIPFPGTAPPLAPAQGDLNSQKTKTPDVGTSSENSEQGFVNFSDKEIQQMPKYLKKLIIIDGKRCRVRIKPSGKDTFTYEIRFRRDGYNISASGLTIQLAKENFIEKAKTAKRKDEMEIAPTSFQAFAWYYFENFREERVSELTYKFDCMRLQNYLIPHFKNLPLTKITPLLCKQLLNRVMKEQKGKTAEELYSLMSVIFKGAIAHGVIERNPINLVLKPQHEKQHGKALSREEENKLLNFVSDTIYETAIALSLYCGLRPNELKTARIEGDFIIAVNSKRKTKKVQYKKIPIIDKLKPHLPEDGKIYIPDGNNIRAKIKAVLPNHKLYDLRTTFYSRCDELGVAPPARNEFVGHSNGQLTEAYRDLSDEYLLNEGEKLNRW